MDLKVLLLAACCLACTNPAAVSPAGTDPVALYPGSPEGDSALLRGRLELEGPCLYILSSETGERWLAAFPAPATVWVAEERAVRIGARMVRVGATGAFGGGESAGTVTWSRPPHAACDARKIWRVTTIDAP